MEFMGVMINYKYIVYNIVCRKKEIGMERGWVQERYRYRDNIGVEFRKINRY